MRVRAWGRQCDDAILLQELAQRLRGRLLGQKSLTQGFIISNPVTATSWLVPKALR
jgi:hypothetical protein